MSDDGKIKPIRAGIKVDSELKPDPDIVAAANFLLEEAVAGRLREFAYAGIAVDGSIYSDFVGDDATPHQMQAELYHLTQYFYMQTFLSRWVEEYDAE